MHCDDCGLTSFVWPKTRVSYNYEYVAARYDRYPTTEPMSKLRMSMILGVLELHESIHVGHAGDPARRGPLLDVGYGNGSFIRCAKACGWDAVGNDVNPSKYDGVKKVDLPIDEDSSSYRVITFFDTLEHFESLQTVRQVSKKADWIFLSYPKPPAGFPFLQPEKLEEWKHFRPGEHHHYFTPKSLQALFSHGGVHCEITYRSAIEDSIRGPGSNGEENIETIALRCHSAGQVARNT